MQERRPFLPDIDERCLHSRQYARYSAQHDVANCSTVRGSLDMKFGDHPALDQCNPGFFQINVDDYYVPCHALGRAQATP
jgi:hypothetical protein